MESVSSGNFDLKVATINFSILLAGYVSSFKQVVGNKESKMMCTEFLKYVMKIQIVHIQQFDLKTGKI